MSEPKVARPKRPRGTYSSLICLSCRDRRIKCDLPREVEAPTAGQLKTVDTPCHRCKRLGISCVVRQTILGRPNAKWSSTVAAGVRSATAEEIVSRISVDFSSRTITCGQSAHEQNETQPIDRQVVPHLASHSSDHLSSSYGVPSSWHADALSIHSPQSTEKIVVIRALETLRYECVEEEWFRHLPAHAGHSHALDLSIKAIVVACAYARGVPKLTPENCYQALALALDAVQATIEQSSTNFDDDVLASTALLAPFEGVVRRNGIATRLHVEGLAAILAARPATYPVTQLARDIVDFNAGESAIMACIQDMASPFETVPRVYLANHRIGCSDSDLAQLKALANELFIRLPRLVRLVRLLRLRSAPQTQLLLDASRLLNSLLTLHDPQAEERLLQTMAIHPPSDLDLTSNMCQKLHFASVKDYEALAYYWQSRLSLLRLERRLHCLSVSSDSQTVDTSKPGLFLQSNSKPKVNEMLRLVKKILMCSGYAEKLPLHKHTRLFTHAMVVVWGVMKDIPVALNHDQGAEERNALPDALLQKVNMALRAEPHLTAEDMDTAADIFVGGQPRGRFAELYGL